ncbi:MAG: hypothetical protein K8R21_02140 [Leptospira sp.]|nr:hypothetical protein [Leptospira sp.]
MAGLYEKIFRKKIIEKTAVKSDIDAILESIIFGSTVSAEKSGKRVLIKSDGISMWIDFRKVDEKYLDQEIFIETVFVRDKRNSSGYRSIPEKTRIYKGKAPALLILNPKEIARNLNDDNIPMVKCFVKGRILEIK